MSRRFAPRGKSFEVNGSAASRRLRHLDDDLALGGLDSSRAPAISLSGRRLGLALVAIPVDEGVGLLLDRALDHELGPEMGELAEWALVAVGDDSAREELVDLPSISADGGSALLPTASISLAGLKSYARAFGCSRKRPRPTEAAFFLTASRY